MAPSADASPTDLVPPPPYLSQEQFDRKTSHAIQLSSSIRQPIVDEDGWPIYDATAFEAVAKSYEQTSPGSSSAGLPGAEMARHQRQASFSSLPPPTDPMKTRSSERRRRNHLPDPDFPSEPRLATPPPPFTATGPSLDGPPFEEVVTLSYHGPDSTQSRAHSLSPVTQPESSRRFSDPLTQTQAQAPSNAYHPHRLARTPPDITSRLIPASAVTRVEFDFQMAYSPNGRDGNHQPVQGATAFYNHAVASQLAASPTTPNSPQTGYPDRVSSPYTSGYSGGNTYQRHQATSPVPRLTPDERYSNHRFSSPAPLPPAPYMVSSTSLPSGPGYAQRPNGAARGPLPPVPHQRRWGGNEAPLVQDVYGGHG